MRLYHHPLSSHARRVTMTALHLGRKLDLVAIDLMDQNDRRRLAELNPNGMVPVLDDDGFVLWESVAIMQYLADCTPGQTLYPQDTQVRADVNRWLVWACQHFAPAIGVVTWEKAWKKIVEGKDTDPVELARGERDLATFATVLDAHLSTRTWVVGDQVTLADYALAAPLMYRESAGLPVETYPGMLAWFERVRALPAWRATEPNH